MKTYHVMSSLFVGAFLLTGCMQKAFMTDNLGDKEKVISTSQVFPPNNGDGSPLPGQPGTIDNNPTLPGSGGTTGTGGTNGVVPGGTMGTGGTTGVVPGGTVVVTPHPTIPGGTIVIIPGGTLPVGGTIVVVPNPGGGTIVVHPVVNHQVPVLYLCSNWGSQHAGSLAQSQNITVVVEEWKKDCRGAQVYCSFNGEEMRTHLLTKKSVSMALVDKHCPNLASGKYRLRILDSATKKDILNPLWSNKITHNGGRYGGIVLHKFGTTWTFKDKLPFILVDANPPKVYNIKCDKSASPLLIHMNSNVAKPEKLVLTPQAQGVFYDILGRNSYPAQHTEKRISWHRSHQYVYITLPDAAGRVMGIDELFGDNTMGPDGQLATNGYEALAKWDGMSTDWRRRIRSADGFIDSQDPIYYALRIWRDENFDGKATGNELYTMKAFGISRIDLDYDEDYDEWDRYGNRTRFKSVVEDSSGKLHLLFDLWFNYLDR